MISRKNDNRPEDQPRKFMNPMDSISIEVRDKFVSDYWKPEWTSPLMPDRIELIEHYIKQIDAASLIQQIPFLLIVHWLDERDYLAKIVNRRRQLEFIDSYGDLVSVDWHKEIEKFIEGKKNDLQKALDEMHPFYLESAPKVGYSSFSDWCKSEPFFDIISKYTIEAMRVLPEVGMISTPSDFETSISDRFSDLGWQSQRTGRSGDQGADVIAEQGNVRLIVQCKLYGRPVGNSAVQEAFSARTFYSGTHAAVVAASGFTTSARQLASSLGVDLVDDLELEEYALSLHQSR